jgi:class 3 adenylate cyclase
MRWGAGLQLTDTATDSSFVLPAGTVTFVLTDIEGSTRLWESKPDAMPEAVAMHYRLLSDAIGRHGGGLVAKVLDGTLDSDLTRDDLLDNITLYWLTNTGVSAARLYWENKRDFFDAKPITIPFAISVFPDELYQAPRSWAERAYPGNLIHYNRLDRGGHFAAWEQPQLFTEEMRAAFRSLRK